MEKRLEGKDKQLLLEGRIKGSLGLFFFFFWSALHVFSTLRLLDWKQF